jgi:hypothetical protein
MPVRIATAVDLETVTALLHDLTPFTVSLASDTDADRWMHVNQPESVELVPGLGARIRTSARVQWTVAGVHLPFTIRSVVLLVGLELAETPTGPRLCVLPKIEDADLKNVPDMIDDKLVELANSRLAAQAGEIGWSMGETLALRLVLPRALAGVDRFDLDVSDVRLVIGSDLIRLEASLPMRFVRDTPAT